LKLDDEAANAIEESVAEIVGIQGNTGKTRLFYARQKLAELLKAAGIERGWP
jgi:RNA polymerase sigma-70 factor, ECF subfamily